MSGPRDGRYDTIARRWLALVERRQEHIIELSHSGRWRHYFTQTEFLAEMHKVLKVREQWAALAGLAAGETAAADGAVVVSLHEERQSRRERGYRRQPQHAEAGPLTPSWTE